MTAANDRDTPISLLLSVMKVPIGWLRPEAGAHPRASAVAGAVVPAGHRVLGVLPKTCI